MIVAMNHTPKSASKLLRAILGRYMWQIGRDTWLWPKASIRNDIFDNLKLLDKKMSVEFYWKDARSLTGFSYCHFGSLQGDRTIQGLFVFQKGGRKSKKATESFRASFVDDDPYL